MIRFLATHRNDKVTVVRGEGEKKAFVVPMHSEESPSIR